MEEISLDLNVEPIELDLDNSDKKEIKNINIIRTNFRFLWNPYRNTCGFLIYIYKQKV